MSELRKAESYGDYLRIPDLLRLQAPLTEAHDELQFIIIHQAFELWFKLMIFELEATRQAMFDDKVSSASHYLRRVQTIIKQLIASFEVIETMRPHDFVQFRDHLKPASGLQSMQYREIEFLCGMKDRRYIGLWKGGTATRLEQRFTEPTLWDAFLALLPRYDLDATNDKAVVQSVIHILKEADRHPLGVLAEQLIELDEHFALWRSRHVQMVMRMIGAKPGTGEVSVAQLATAGYAHMGPSGVDYLRTTLQKSFFPLLWEARTFVER